MIESSILPQDAVEELNRIEAAKAQEAAVMGRSGALQELLRFCRQWYDSARTWRKQSFESDWLIWQRNCDSKYDPALARQKKKWQAKAFVDITPSHRETIHAELYRLTVGSRPILEMLARPGGDPDQAENIRDLELRELEKSRFEVEYNKILEDATTFGSGFCRLRWETKVEPRITRQPVYEPINIYDLGSIKRAAVGQRQIIGYEPVKENRVLYRGVRIEWIPILDFFPDPKALRIQGNLCGFRSWLSLQDLIRGVESGYYLPEAAAVLREERSDETNPPDKSLVQIDRGISDVVPIRLDYQKKFQVIALDGRFPQKLIYPLLSQPLPVDNAEELVPARVTFHAQGKTICAVELNDDYEGEPPYLKLDYFHVNGRFYGRGIPEMTKNPQMVINEVVNQRLDEGNLALMEGYAVIEKAIVNTQELEEGGPGLVVRLNAKALGPNGDVRAAIMPLGRPDVKRLAGFSEVNEWERMAQERTSANRVTLGTGAIHDQNRTYHGQALLKESAGEKFAYIALVQEFTFLYSLFRAYWRLIYSNITPEDVMDALGPERASKFQLMSPEEVEKAYKYEPQGIFTQQGKDQMQARVDALVQRFGNQPWFDILKAYELECKSFDVDPQRMKVPEAEAMDIMNKAQQMAKPMAVELIKQEILQKAAKDILNDQANDVADKVDGDKNGASEGTGKENQPGEGSS